MEFKYSTFDRSIPDMEDVEEMHLYWRLPNSSHYQVVSTVSDAFYYAVHLPCVSMKELNGELLFAAHTLYHGMNGRYLIRYDIEQNKWSRFVALMFVKPLQLMYVVTSTNMSAPFDPGVYVQRHMRLTIIWSSGQFSRDALPCRSQLEESIQQLEKWMKWKSMKMVDPLYL